MTFDAWPDAPAALAARVDAGEDALARAPALGLDLPPGAAAMTLETDAAAAAVFAVDPARSGDEDARLALAGPTSAELAAEAASLAAAAGARVLTTQAKARDDGEAACALASAGFSAIDTAVVHEVRVPAAAASIARGAPGLAARLGEAGGLRTASLAGADLETVRAVLEAECLMDGFEFDARRRADHPRALALAESVAVLAGGALAGFLLLERVPGTANDYAIVARWVAPEARTGVVNLALVAEALGRAEAAGVERVRFAANPDRHADTMALARRLGATALFTQSRFRRALGP